MSDKPTPPYFSFLICSHESGALVNVYFNGLPLGIVRYGTFEPRIINGRPITIGNLIDPCPFETFEVLKNELKQVLDQIKIN